MIDLPLARTLLNVAGSYGDRPLPDHVRADLLELAAAEHLPSFIRRDATSLLRRHEPQVPRFEWDANV